MIKRADVEYLINVSSDHYQLLRSTKQETIEETIDWLIEVYEVIHPIGEWSWEFAEDLLILYPKGEILGDEEYTRIRFLYQNKEYKC